MSREKAADLAVVVLLGVALVQAVLVVGRGGGEPVRAWFPLLGPADPPGALQGEGGAARALQARAAAVGEFVTVEDLARGVVALRDGTLTGVAPLSDAERAALMPLLERANTDRLELLRVEAEIAGVQSDLQDRARAIAATLTAEQRAWIVANRDQVSVGELEQAYWDELLGASEPAPPQPGGHE